MKPIVTLTLNPAIDASCQADEVRPVHKIGTFGWCRAAGDLVRPRSRRPDSHRSA
jgi:hypothetical protein